MIKSEKTFIVIIICVILLFGWIYMKLADFSPKDDVLLQKIKNIELKLDSIKDKKDSIRIVIDSTHVKIITNEKHFQERITTILTQSSSTDSGEITDYIRQFANENPQYNLGRAQKTEN